MSKDNVVRLSLTKPQKQFLDLNCPFPAFIAGYGCVHESTEILTASGFRPISEVGCGELVVSFNTSTKQCELSSSSGGFIKGIAPLYKVTTNKGFFIATENHRIYYDKDKYVCLCNAKVGDKITNIYNNVITKSNILRIEKYSNSEEFWDIHVVGNNNYITRDGTIHHNSGKSQIMCVKAIMDSREGGADSLVALYEPTYDLVRLILYPRMSDLLTEFGIRFKLNKHEQTVYTSNGGMGDFIFRSMDNPSRIVGYESFRAGVDEMDTLKLTHAEQIWNRIIGRNRQHPKTYVKSTDRPMNGVSVFTTPEGFNFVYKFWVSEVEKDPEKARLYKMVKASSYSNPFLSIEYLDNLLASYPDQLKQAYIDGEFVNLSSGSVYKNYDRYLNDTTETIQDYDNAVHIGIDFNVGSLSGAVTVLRSGYPHVVDEVVGVYDTPELIELLKNRYWVKDGTKFKRTRQIIIYPDASSNSKKTINASVTDQSLMRQAGFEVRSLKTNPPIIDRVNSLNAMICNGKMERRLLINKDKCPSLANSLEKQPWGRNGLPDKVSGYDNICIDGLGYLIYYLFPINFKRVTTSQIGV